MKATGATETELKQLKASSMSGWHIHSAQMHPNTQRTHIHKHYTPIRARNRSSAKWQLRDTHLLPTKRPALPSNDHATLRPASPVQRPSTNCNAINSSQDVDAGNLHALKRNLCAFPGRGRNVTAPVTQPSSSPIPSCWPRCLFPATLVHSPRPYILRHVPLGLFIATGSPAALIRSPLIARPICTEKNQVQ